MILEKLIEKKGKIICFLRGNILLESSKEFGFLVLGLEASASEFRGGIDPFQINLLQRLPAGMNLERLPQREHPLLDTRTRALEHYKVVLDLAVSDEATQWGDRLVRDVEFGGTVVRV